MNNNRGNNRRRGRGGNRQQGGQQTNRIDSRARGNAPQLLEKYRKLAHDAHLNGDRVQEEYYLQFADHYFRVIADQRQRQEEARQPRRDDRGSDYRVPDYGDDLSPEDEAEIDIQRSYQGSYQERGNSYQERGNGGNDSSEERFEPAESTGGNGGESERSVYEPAENPFVRDNRGPRSGLKQRRERRDRDQDGEAAAETVATKDPASNQDQGENEAPSGAFDPSALPPAISAKADEKPKRRTRAKAKVEDEVTGEGEEKPKRRRTRKTGSSDEAPDGGSGSTLETVN